MKYIQYSEMANRSNICGYMIETIQLALGKKRMIEEEGLAHLSGSEGWVNTVVRVSSRWFEEDTVTDRHQTGPRSLLFRRFSSSRGIHSRWLPKNTSRETNTATAILRRRTNSWTDHAQKQRVRKFYESWIAFASSFSEIRKKMGERMWKDLAYFTWKLFRPR